MSLRSLYTQYSPGQPCVDNTLKKSIDGHVHVEGWSTFDVYLPPPCSMFQRSPSWVSFLWSWKTNHLLHLGDASISYLFLTIRSQSWLRNSSSVYSRWWPLATTDSVMNKQSNHQIIIKLILITPYCSLQQNLFNMSSVSG